MRVARFYAPGDLRLEDAPDPVAGRGELVIRVGNCSTCGTDAKILRHGHHHLVPPRVIGHEIAGEVVDVGEDADSFEVGDRVQVIAAIPCGVCDICLRGWQTICPNQTSMGYHYDGGFAEYMVVPENVLRVDGVNRIPEGVSFAEASVTEPLACVLNGQEHARVGADDHVVVIGAGPIGCLHVRLARARGASRVSLVDINPDRLSMSAERVEPDDAIRSANTDSVAEIMAVSGGRGADVVIVAAASSDAQRDALAMAARRGRVSFFGGLPKDKPITEVDANKVHYSELTIVGANGSSPQHNRTALGLIASRAVPVADLITHRMPLEDVHKAIETVAAGEAIKVTIEP
jgi:L-iditol 2-dehydrogenase